MFDAPDDDPGHAPWIAVRNLVRARGGEISTTYRRPQDVESADWVCFMNLPHELQPVSFGIRNILQRLRSRLQPQMNNRTVWGRLVSHRRQSHAALFLWEPEVVQPENYLPLVHKNFAKVFTWHRGLLEAKGVYRPIIWPQASGVQTPSGLPFGKRKLLVNFSGNKQSKHPFELYSARLEVIRYMEKHHLAMFDHFGPGWSSDFPSWRGTVESKHEIYPLYRYGLTYENMKSVGGYTTEKVFDCLRAGCVPIYWGDPDISELLPEKAFIDRRRFNSTADLIEFLLGQSEADWLAQRTAGQTFLDGDTFKRFLPQSFAEKFIEGLDK